MRESEHVHLHGYYVAYNLIRISHSLKTGNMDTFLLLSSIGAPEIIIVALLILLLFGGKKIPELMKGIGKGVRSFKEGLKDVEDEINKDPEEKNPEEKK